MFIYHFISIFNQIYTFVFKRTLTLFNFFFSLINNHIFHLIQVVFIIINFQKFWCFMIDGNYFFGFNHAEFIHRIVNNSVVFLFFWTLFLGMGYWYRG